MYSLFTESWPIVRSSPGANPAGLQSTPGAGPPAETVTLAIEAPL